MEVNPVKPPWQHIEFQSSPFFESSMIESIVNVPFDISWNELPHQELSDVKAKIEPLETNHLWELFKKKTNPYELIYTQENHDCPASLAYLKPLSRSYFKMIEMLQVSQFFEKLPKQNNLKLRSSHVAEGPGGFIEAFIDRAESNRIPVQKCHAITLKPTTSHVPGWRRSYQFLQKHPEVKIHYGSDGTGDIYVQANQQSFIQLHEMKSHLFTGDGGFDFSTDYENQEKSIYSLLVASAIIGLQTLTPEGFFILKLFDVNAKATQYLLRCISLCFREWSLYKPATSRPCNAERYFICRGFRKVYPQILKALLQLQTQWNMNQSVPQCEYFSFFTEKEKTYLETHIREFSLNQLQNLEKTIQLQNVQGKHDWKEQYSHAQKWCTEFRVPTNTGKR